MTHLRGSACTLNQRTRFSEFYMEEDFVLLEYDAASLVNPCRHSIFYGLEVREELLYLTLCPNTLPYSVR